MPLAVLFLFILMGHEPAQAALPLLVVFTEETEETEETPFMPVCLAVVL
jgi:hypothetical protein